MMVRNFLGVSESLLKEGYLWLLLLLLIQKLRLLIFSMVLAWFTILINGAFKLDLLHRGWNKRNMVHRNKWDYLNCWKVYLLLRFAFILTRRKRQRNRRWDRDFQSHSLVRVSRIWILLLLGRCFLGVVILLLAFRACSSTRHSRDSSDRRVFN